MSRKKYNYFKKSFSLYNVILKSSVCKNGAKLSATIGTIGAIARMMPTNMAWYLQGRILGMDIARNESINLFGMVVANARSMPWRVGMVFARGRGVGGSSCVLLVTYRAESAYVLNIFITLMG